MSPAETIIYPIAYIRFSQKKNYFGEIIVLEYPQLCFFLMWVGTILFAVGSRWAMELEAVSRFDYLYTIAMNLVGCGIFLGVQGFLRLHRLAETTLKELDNDEPKC